MVKSLRCKALILVCKKEYNELKCEYVIKNVCKNLLRGVQNLNSDSKTKKLAWFSLFMLLILAVFIFLIKNVDVSPTGPFDRVVGLSSINAFFVRLLGINLFWYKVTNLPGIVLNTLVGFIFAMIGLKQWIQRKNILKVDKNILALGGLYVVTLFIYFFCEKFVINYRPIILEGEKLWEPSFPSSHTMWTIVIMGAAIMECCRLIKNQKTRIITITVLYMIIFVTVIGRTISGVHWFTDIIGGILISGTLLVIYRFVISILDSRDDYRKIKRT